MSWVCHVILVQEPNENQLQVGRNVSCIQFQWEGPRCALHLGPLPQPQCRALLLPTVRKQSLGGVNMLRIHPPHGHERAGLETPPQPRLGAQSPSATPLCWPQACR